MIFLIVYLRIGAALALAPIRARGAQDSLGRLCRHCAQPVTIWPRYACQIYLVSNPQLCCGCRPVAPEPILKRPNGRLNIGWGARIRTMIKRTKISCPTIRRHPKSGLDYSRFSDFFNNKIIFVILGLDF